MFERPDIPRTILDDNLPEEFSENCARLWVEIITELLSDNFFWQAHYRRHTYDSGCRGPLCSKFMRDNQKSRPRSNIIYRPRPERVYDPVIDFYRIVALKQVTEHYYKLQQSMKGFVVNG